MKRKLQRLMASAIILSALNFGCNSKNEQLINWAPHVESVKDVTLPPDRQVTIQGVAYNLKSLAKYCVSEYKSAIALGTLPDNLTVTDYIAFKQPSLQKWIDRANGADSIKFEFGIYTQRFITAMNLLNQSRQSDDQGNPYPSMAQSLVLRTTIFLFAYKRDGTPFVETSGANSGKELPAYNLGNLHP